jgi:hypothetical protein
MRSLPTCTTSYTCHHLFTDVTASPWQPRPPPLNVGTVRESTQELAVSQPERFHLYASIVNDGAEKKIAREGSRQPLGWRCVVSMETHDKEMVLDQAAASNPEEYLLLCEVGGAGGLSSLALLMGWRPLPLGPVLHIQERKIPLTHSPGGSPFANS